MKYIVKLYDLLCHTADAAIEIQNGNGSFPPGCNVYYNDPETPARNTSHWLITLLKAYSYSNIDRYRKSAIKAVNYLLSSSPRPMGASFWCRKNPHKDFCNGIVGQAFIIEALSLAYEVLNIEATKELAEEVFLLHPFDEQNALWRSVSVDGSYLSVDQTFNHQLWFATAGAELWRVAKNNEIGKRVNLFINALSRNMDTHTFFHKGLIFHFISKHYSFKKKGLSPHIKRLRALILQNTNSEITRAIKYHAFNLWAFPILKSIFPDNVFWNSNKFKNIVNYISSNDFIKHKLKLGFDDPNSKHIFYNLNIYEAYTLIELSNVKGSIEKAENILSSQYEHEYDEQSHMFNKNATDKHTQAARFYEASRLPNINLTFNKNVFGTIKSYLTLKENPNE